MSEQAQKFNIEKGENDLKLYFFTVQGGPMIIQLPEDFKAVMAYTDTDACNMIRKDYPFGALISLKKRGQIEIKKIVNAINLDVKTPQPVEVQTDPELTKNKTVQDFIYGMMLIADKFIIDKRDKASIRRIIKKIKINENTTNDRSPKGSA